jgi:hypothetical protein
MNIEFIDFWPGFENEPNIFLDYFRNNSHVCDKLAESGVTKVVFRSVFPEKTNENRLQRKLARLKNSQESIIPVHDPGCLSIWYSGENIRPPLAEDFHGYLSFDLDNFGGRNAYFPLIFLSLNPFGINSQKRLGKNYSAENLLKRRTLSSKKMDNSICVIAGKHPMRVAAVDELRKYFKVDIFGGMSNYPVGEKYSVAKNYKYMLCFENDLYPGYVTEKLVEAYVCETIPLYWGSTEGNGYLNPESYINLRDFQDMETWAKQISVLSETQYREIYEQPLLLSEPPVVLQLSEFFDSILQRYQFHSKNG